MNIALYHNLPSGGAKRSFYYVAKFLSQQGHILDLYTLNRRDTDEFLPLDPYVRRIISKECWMLPWVNNGHPLIANTRNLYRQIKSLRSMNRISRQLAELINTGEYDIALVTHCRFFQSPNILRYLTIPSIYYCHEPFRRFYEPAFSYGDEHYQGESSRQPHTVLRKIAELSSWIAKCYLLKQNDIINIRHAKVILANSYYSRESIYRAYGISAFVNYLGIDGEQFRPLPDVKKENIVLAVGRFFPGKQHHFVLQSLSWLSEDERPELVIIGDSICDDTYKTYLETLASRLHVAVRMLVNIPDEELVSWYNRAQVVVYPPILEPFGFIPLEAMACQTPVVGIREGGIRETIVDGVTGFLTDRDEKEFAQAISRLLQDPSLRQKMGENGRTYVLKHWTWEKSVEQLLKHFSRLHHNYCKSHGKY
jgi:glycosyltransferase involved in cell wall biosynthesis